MSENIYEIIMRVASVFVVGLFFIILMQGFKIRGLWRSYVGKKYLGWLMIVPVYLLAILSNSYLAISILFLIQIFLLSEINKVMNSGIGGTIVNFSLLLLTNIVAVFYGKYFLISPILYFYISCLTGILKNDKEKSFDTTIKVFFISIWVIFASAHLILLYNLGTEIYMNQNMLVFLGFCAVLGDVFAFIFGKLSEKTNFLTNYKIANNINPKKTYIGLTGFLFGTFLSILIMYFFLREYFTIFQLFIVGLGISFSLALGDITESAFKRYFKVKDMGEMIIGHGGLMDRCDSFLLATIFLYYFLYIFLN